MQRILNRVPVASTGLPPSCQRVVVPAQFNKNNVVNGQVARGVFKYTM